MPLVGQVEKKGETDSLTILDVADAYVLLSPFAARYAVEPSPKGAAFDTTNVSLGMAALGTLS